MAGVITPVRSLWQRFAYALLIAAAFSLMLLGKAEVLLVERARVALTDAFTPLLEVLSRPAASVTEMADRVARWRDMEATIQRLEEENARLRRWQFAATRLDAENLALRRLSKFVPPPQPNFISARVIADAGGAFVRSVLINVGERQGVRRGLAVVSGEGLAGSVVEVGLLHARVLLVTDLNAQIPVFIESSRDPAVLVGDNSNQLRLLYLPQNAKVSPGDRVVTSGHGGVFPPGLPVGMVTSISEAGVRVKPVVDWTHLEFVRVLDYNLRGVVGAPDGPPAFSALPPGYQTAPSDGSVQVPAGGARR